MAGSFTESIVEDAAEVQQLLMEGNVQNMHIASAPRTTACTRIRREVVIYQNELSRNLVTVRPDGETAWLTHRQMAEMFDRSADNISLHLKNILSESELAEPGTAEEFSVVRTEGRCKASKDLIIRLIISRFAEPRA